MATDIENILKLPIEERLEIMEKIWESLENNKSSNIPNWHIEILQERFNKHKDNLSDGKSWEEVKRKLLQS